MKKIT